MNFPKIGPELESHVAASSTPDALRLAIEHALLRERLNTREIAARMCESRSRSHSRTDNHNAAIEAKKCAGVIRTFNHVFDDYMKDLVDNPLKWTQEAKEEFCKVMSEVFDWKKND